MDCNECKNLISSFMDDELEEPRSSEVRSHLALCDGCAQYCEEIAAILDVCTTESPSDILPPNSKALWCRINNIIESEKKPQPAPQAEHTGAHRPRFSFLQATTGVICIAVASSILTIIAIRSYSEPSALAPHSPSQTIFEKALGKVGLMETPQQARERRVREQQAAIDYWNERVQTRRIAWDNATRSAFDRNLQVIDESVNDYSMILARDPDDELSGEMLDSVLDDKMNLLRDFSGL